MGSRRKHRPGINATRNKTISDICCWYCGNTRNVPASKYDGLCMSCFFDFHEDDIQLDLFKEVLCTSA